MVTPIALGMPGGAEWIVIAAIGLLLFGKRLPEVGRSLGKGIVEFKKGLKGIEEDVEQVDTNIDNPASRRALTHEETKGDYKFDPYTGKPMRFDPYTGKPINADAPTTEPATEHSDEH